MDGLQGKTLLELIDLGGYHYFRKHPYKHSYKGILKKFRPQKRTPTFANLPSDTLPLLQGDESARGNHLAFRGTDSHDSPGGPQEVANLPENFRGNIGEIL